MESAGIRSGFSPGKWSIYGALFFLISSIVASIVAKGLAAPFVLLYVIVWSVLISPDSLSILKKGRFWFLLASLTVLSAVAMGGEDTRLVGGVPVSLEGLSAGVGMAIRASTIVLATAAFARAASIGSLSALFARLGVAEIGFLLGIAVNLLPAIQATAGNVLMAMRLRGGFRRNRIQAVKRLVVTILVNSLRYSEDIVCAAESRAFGESRPAAQPISVTFADRALVVSSVVVYSFMVLTPLVFG